MSQRINNTMRFSKGRTLRVPIFDREIMDSRSSSFRQKRRMIHAFTLLEVMIAVGILFMCLFAVLALLGNSLRSARLLQRHRALDTATVDGLVYVQAANTN